MPAEPAQQQLRIFYEDHHGGLQGWLRRKLGNAFDAMLNALQPQVRNAFLWARLEGLTCPQSPCGSACRWPPSNVISPPRGAIATRCISIDRLAALRLSSELNFSRDIPATVIDAAIDGAVKLDFNSPTTETRQAFDLWLQATPQHKEA